LGHIFTLAIGLNLQLFISAEQSLQRADFFLLTDNDGLGKNSHL
jgi:hypothetical protein